ncbi:MAG: malonate decarboxylase holo-[acyl-carrier-protein] synthase [Terrimicrobiaceae bacterium]
MSSTKSFGPERFHRHAFVSFAPSGSSSASDLETGGVLQDWLENGRSLIVRRPCLSPDGSQVSVGLALPPSPHKRRLAFDLSRSDVRGVALPPLWEDCAARKIDAVVPIRAAAEAGGIGLRTFGSHAWQHLTGLRYVTEKSDIDLLLFVNSRQSWEIIRSKLEQTGPDFPPGIDLEIVLNEDASFSWREFSSTPQRLLYKGNSRVWLGDKSDIDGILRG